IGFTARIFRSRVMNSFVRNAGKFFRLVGSLVAVFCLIGCGTVAHSPSTQSGTGEGTVASAAPSSTDQAADTSVNRGDILRVGDPITVTFAGVTEPPPAISERIKADGALRLPFVDEPLKAEGTTRGQLEEEIYRIYVPAIYKRLTVKVGSEGRYITVKGEVRTSGRVPYLGGMTVLRAIAAAGDFTDFAARKHVLLRRTTGQEIKVDCLKALKHRE